MKSKKQKQRNPFAGSLAHNKYRKQVIPNKKKKERDNPKMEEE